MEQNIKNPSLIPDWFITSGGKVTGIHDANGNEYQFVGASEKGEDGKTPILYISADDCHWYADYRDGRGPILVSQSPAASGMVGPQGETGPSGNSIVLQSAEPADGGVKVTLAWGENETSAFVIPSGAPGSSYAFDQTTTSGDGSAEEPIGVNTDVIATKEDLDDYVKQDDLLPESGLSGDYVSQDNKYHFGIATSGLDANKQYAWTTNGWQEVTAQGSIAAGTDLVLAGGVMKVNTNGVANEDEKAFVEGVDTAASGAASHAEGRNTSAMSDYSHTEGYENKDNKIEGLIGANHIEGAYNQTSAVYSHVEGHANTVYGYGVHMQGGYNEFYSHNLSADRSDPEGRWNIWGQSIEGMANKTTTEPVSGYDSSTPLYTHGGILKVIGNGTRTVDSNDQEHIDRSDALILYRDGSMWVQGPISANGVELGNYTPTLPLNIGTNNTVTNDSIGAIGNNCNAGVKSIVMSYQGATAISNSLAVGDGNYASANAGAFGWKASATDYGFALGHYVMAHDYSVAFGHGDSNNISTADKYSIINGDAVSAFNYSQAFGRGLVASGNPNSKGLMAIGGWNKTQSNALFVVGNGTGNGNRSDAFIVYYNGSIKEGNTNVVTSENTHVEGVNNTDTGVTSTSFTPGVNHIEGGHNTSNGGLYNHIEGEANHVWGDRVHMEGNRNIYSAANYEWGVSIEGMACATSANTPNVHGGILKVIGNGTRGKGDVVNRSDAYILYRDGTVKAKDYIAGGDTLSANYPVPKSVPNIGDSTMKVQRMFVCTSDNDIIAHLNAGLSEGEGCVFFRVGS